jgi:maltose alpha-D-glucosyltransferase / alpha-amylase
MNDNPQASAPAKTELWYKSAIIYEVHVRAFQDSNGDGTGDFRGLTARLDYLRDLGVTALWVLPFYPSPLKDDGYDIADYYGVHPQYGTLGDFKLLLREAHCRGLRVITELVLNHTSDQHPWFQRARRAKPGSRWRDYYVWSNTPEKYKGTRIIFKDTEISNWTWDPLANAYYWHRFYSHQPDLNFDHAVVQQEMFNVLDFWMDIGVDGVRLDAVPYLYEREGTSCENLPETHAFLKLLRKHVDENYGDRMLLAEANQWPDDAVAYFGAGRGDECHMAFHFPLMPRLFMALRMEDRIPIVDILQQTPPVPETAQWALFLRNHDELTLEMVTDEERDYMYRMYAHIHQARLNLGIRRRLAPLVGNDRKRIELLCALLFSLPGTPVIYYGDEIGMGENIYLGDRNGVRTPMQWSADKNAGFSRANPQSLYLPINLDPENHYEAVNVEVQEQNRHSLLWWMRQLIALRKRWKSFGLGTLEFLHPENRKVLAYVRRYENECILAVVNLSRFVQPLELDLSSFQSRVPVELFGRTEFPLITDKPYFLTLGPHSFYWFSLETKATAQVESAGAPVGAQARALLQVGEDWEEIFRDGNRIRLEAALQSWLPSRRWFGGKAKIIKTVNLQEFMVVPMEAEKAFLVFLQVEYVQAEPEIYVLPLACALAEKADLVSRDWPPLVLARVSVKHSNQDGVLYDAIADKTFCRAMLDLMSNRRSLPGRQGELAAMHTAVLRRLRREGGLNLEASVSKAEQTNSSVIYGDRLILKFFRRLDIGVNPDLEIGRFLTARKFAFAPPLAGALEYRSLKDEPMTVAILHTFVPGCTSAWDYTLDTLGRFYERVQTLPAQRNQPPALPAVSIAQLAAAELPPAAGEMIGSYLQDARLLGERTALMHLTLASETDDPSFRPEPWTPHAQRGLFQSMRNLTRQNFQLLNQRLKSLPPETQAQAQQVLALEAELLQRFRKVYEGRIDAVRIRNHGDYHLGQILHTGKDFLIIDFEGEPAIPLSERSLKRSPLQDVAGLILSFHYAAQVALLKQTEHGSMQEGQMKAAAAWARYWSKWVSATFVKAYLESSHSAPYLPATEDGLHILLEAALVRNTVYELGYELNNRPDWVKIPLQAFLELMNPEGHS